MNGRGVLIDTGPLISLVSTSDENHERCTATLASLPAPLITCWPVLTEAAWMLRNTPRGFARIVSNFGSGLLVLAELGADDLAVIHKFMERYQDAGVQLADASLAYIAEREDVRTVFTLDRRDFSIIRLKRNRSLTIIP